MAGVFTLAPTAPCAISVQRAQPSATARPPEGVQTLSPQGCENGPARSAIAPTSRMRGPCTPLDGGGAAIRTGAGAGATSGAGGVGVEGGARGAASAW